MGESGDKGPPSYLMSLPEQQQVLLARENRRGVEVLRQMIDGRQAVAFLGAGVSAPLYPLWSEAISELILLSQDELSDEARRTCQELAASRPDSVVEILRRE